jgi:hypothetical protein
VADRPTFGWYYLNTLLHPRRAFEALMQDPRRLKFSMWVMLITAALYTWVYINLVIGGGSPNPKPFFDIPSEVFYQYNRWWLLPSMFGCWILAAGVAQLLSRLFRGKGTFEDTLSALGFATAAATLASLAHDLPETILGATGVINFRVYEAQLNAATPAALVLWIFYGLYAVLFVVLYPLAVRSAQKIKLGPAILVGELAFIVYQGVFFIFNR